MRIGVVFSALLMWTNAAFAAPLDWLSEQQKKDLLALYTGINGGVICSKKVDMGVANRFLESKLASLKITPSQLVDASFMAVSLHAAELGMLIRQQPAKEVFPKHCKEVDRLFGPVGTVIPGLLGPQLKPRAPDNPKSGG
jgi:hypothetical protein